MISLKALSKNPFKSLLIFSSITIAVMAIFLISSVSQGVIGMYSKMIKTDGDIIITQKGISDTFFSNVNISLIEEINRVEDVVKLGDVIDVKVIGIDDQGKIKCSRRAAMKDTDKSAK